MRRWRPCVREGEGWRCQQTGWRRRRRRSRVRPALWCLLRLAVRLLVFLLALQLALQLPVVQLLVRSLLLRLLLMLLLVLLLLLILLQRGQRARLRRQLLLVCGCCPIRRVRGSGKVHAAVDAQRTRMRRLGRQDWTLTRTHWQRMEDRRLIFW